MGESHDLVRVYVEKILVIFGLGVSWVNLMPQKGVVHWRKYGDLMVIYGYLW